MWIGPWMLGLTLISLWGNYGSDGDGHKSAIFPGTQWDIVVVAVFSFAIYYWAVSLAVPTDVVRSYVEEEAEKVEEAEEAVAV